MHSVGLETSPTVTPRESELTVGPQYVAGNNKFDRP